MSLIRQRRIAMAATVALAVTLGGCAAVERLYATGGPPAYASVTELFDDLGGEQWCGGDLRVTLEPAVGSCGDDEERVAMAAAYVEAGEIVHSVDRRAEGSQLLLLVPTDVEDGEPWFQLRSPDRELLEQAQGVVGGDLLDGPTDVEAWVARNRGALEDFRDRAAAD